MRGPRNLCIRASTASVLIRPDSREPHLPFSGRVGCRGRLPELIDRFYQCERCRPAMWPLPALYQGSATQRCGQLTDRTRGGRQKTSGCTWNMERISSFTIGCHLRVLRCCVSQPRGGHVSKHPVLPCTFIDRQLGFCPPSLPLVLLTLSSYLPFAPHCIESLPCPLCCPYDGGWGGSTWL